MPACFLFVCFFVFNFSLILVLLQLYLLAGYYYTATEEYDIKWTMPHCVLMLKLVGEWAQHIFAPFFWSSLTNI